MRLRGIKRLRDLVKGHVFYRRLVIQNGTSLVAVLAAIATVALTYEAGYADE